MIELSNEHLSIQVNPMGAELVSVVDQKSGYEFMWQKDPNYWNRTAPILFPIVGRLKENSYYYQDQHYLMYQHGFARDLEFQVQTQTENSVSLFLKNSPETQAIYPFEFSLQVTYILYDNQVTVSYEVLNPSRQEPLYYSIGGHPAFKVSLKKDDQGKVDFDRVSFCLTPGTKYLRIPLNADNLSKPLAAQFESVEEFPLYRELFKNDALVYRIAERTGAILTDEAAGVRIEMDLNRMPYLGLWSMYPEDAPFVSIEPWAGIADNVDANQELEDKDGIQALEPNHLNVHGYAMTFSKEDR